MNTQANTWNDANTLEKEWSADRWKGVKRTYSPQDVAKLRGTVKIEYSLAKYGAERLWELLKKKEYINALGALTGNMAVQQVRVGKWLQTRTLLDTCILIKVCIRSTAFRKS